MMRLKDRCFARILLAGALAAFAVSVPTVPAAAAAPTVRSVEFISPPQSGDTYGVGERITVKVQWNEFVNIRGAASGFTGQPDPGFRMNGTLASGYIGVDYRPTK